MKQIPRYMQLITDGRIVVPSETVALSAVAKAWATPSAEPCRAVVVPS